MKKIAVIFPGIGYHTDKPLLYYSRMIVRQAGYEVVEVPYRNFPKRIRGDRDKMEKALMTGLQQAEEILAPLDFSQYEKILFISKSIGTAIATVYGVRRQIRADHLWYTPLTQTLEVMEDRGLHGEILAFHGTGDPWARTPDLTDLCADHAIPLKLTEGGNHSLETGETFHDLQTLCRVMEETGRFIKDL